MTASRPTARSRYHWAHRGAPQFSQLVELLLGHVVAREAAGTFELGDERVERAVLMVGRIEIACAARSRCAATAPQRRATCRSPARPKAARRGLRQLLPAASAAAEGRAQRLFRGCANPFDFSQPHHSYRQRSSCALRTRERRNCGGRCRFRSPGRERVEIGHDATEADPVIRRTLRVER